MEAFPALVICLRDGVRAERENGQVFELVFSDGESWEVDEGILHIAIFDNLSVYGDDEVVQLDKHRNMVALAV